MARRNLRPWSHMPWLDLRCSELCRTTGFDSREVYAAARTLWENGVPDTTAANILVAADSEAGQIVGIEAFVDAALAVIDRTWETKEAQA
jgi:hypothetical protein